MYAGLMVIRRTVGGTCLFIHYSLKAERKIVLIFFFLSSLTPISLDLSLLLPSPFIVDTSGGDGLYSDTVGGH